MIRCNMHFNYTEMRTVRWMDADVELEQCYVNLAIIFNQISLAYITIAPAQQQQHTYIT